MLNALSYFLSLQHAQHKEIDEVYHQHVFNERVLQHFTMNFRVIFLGSQ
jgi:hypothetical protein